MRFSHKYFIKKNIYNLQAKDIRVSEVDFNPEYIARIIPKLDWTVLWKAAESVNLLCHIFTHDLFTNIDAYVHTYIQKTLDKIFGNIFT